MESIPEKENDNSANKKLLYDINNSTYSIEDNEYCPHILNHFLNPYMNSILNRITISSPSDKTDSKNNPKKTESIYFHNLSLFQNPFKSHIYISYPQSLNIFNSFLLKIYL